MNIKQTLESEYSKVARDKIMECIQQNPEKVAELMSCFFDTNVMINQRASLTVGNIAKHKPQLLLPFFGKMIKMLENPRHDGGIRNIIRTWQFMKIPEEFQGKIFEICFRYILDPKISISIRIFSMTVCANICNEIPDLKEELALAISDSLENGSPGFLNRGKKILKSLSK